MLITILCVYLVGVLMALVILLNDTKLTTAERVVSAPQSWYILYLSYVQLLQCFDRKTSKRKF